LFFFFSHQLNGEDLNIWLKAKTKHWKLLLIFCLKNNNNKKCAGVVTSVVILLAGVVLKFTYLNKDIKRFLWGKKKHFHTVKPLNLGDFFVFLRVCVFYFVCVLRRMCERVSVRVFFTSVQKSDLRILKTTWTTRFNPNTHREFLFFDAQMV